jgi:hypothetical protein
MEGGIALMLVWPAGRVWRGRPLIGGAGCGGRQVLRVPGNTMLQAAGEVPSSVMVLVDGKVSPFVGGLERVGERAYTE